MADLLLAAVDATEGLSGQSVRGAVEGGANAPAAQAAPSAAQAAGQAAASGGGIESTVQAASEQLRQGFDQAAQVMGQAGSAAQAAAQNAGQGGGESVMGLGASFSWSGYVQAIGVLFLLLAALWLVVWLMRRYGKFNFLPRPDALPRDALVMEAQMPLGPRKGLMVVRFLNRRLLLGVTDQQITLLTEEKAHHEPRNADFGEIMEAARNEGSSGSGSSVSSA